MRYFCAGYLIFLAFKSARSALAPNPAASILNDEPATNRAPSGKPPSLKRAYRKGMAVHMANPKVVLFFGSLFAIGVPADATPAALIVIILSVGLQSALILHGYAIVFSSAPMIRGYLRMRKGFESVFAIAFAAAGLKILTTRIQ